MTNKERLKMRSDSDRNIEVRRNGKIVFKNEEPIPDKKGKDKK